MKNTTAIRIVTTLFLLAGVLLSCKKESEPVVKSSKKDIASLLFTDFSGTTPAFDPATNTYSISVAAGTNVKALKVTFALPSGAASKPESGAVQDFTTPVTYIVTAEDGSTKAYTVAVLVQAPPKSTEKQITAFSFATLPPVVQAVINPVTRRITATLPADANLTALVPTITLSPKATVSPASGVAQNFTAPVNYTVTAEDGSLQVYQVAIDVRVVTAVPGGLGLSDFYKKYVDASGIPVVSSAKVPDAALIQARNTINQMLDKRPDVVAKLKLNKMRVAIMAESEVTIDIPEHSDLYTAFPGTDWNTRARGHASTPGL